MTITPKRGKLLTAGQAATYLGLSIGQVRQLADRRRPQISVVRSEGGRLLGIYASACDEWLVTREVPPARDPQIARATVRAEQTDRVVGQLPGAGRFM